MAEQFAPLILGELLAEEMNSATMVVAREVAAYGVQAMPLLVDNQAAPVTLKIRVTAQQEPAVNRSAPLAQRSVPCFGGLITALRRLRFNLSTLLLDMKHDAADRFMRDTICGCYGAERFFLLYHTMHHGRPL
jgi:hypothetical protein